VPIEGVPFNDSWGVIVNEAGRVLDPTTKEPVVGQYTAGWIKRGPSGIIGTNKPDAVETVTCMMADLAEGKVNQPAQPDKAAVSAFVDERQPKRFTYEDWLKVKAAEIALGEAQGRPRVKFTSVDEMLAVAHDS
jgi:ferredoxin--NADP+ reductase